MTEEKKRVPKKEKGSKTKQNMEIDDKVVFIGKKPVMSYVIACLTHLSSGSNKIVVKARGRAIPKAVDTIELLRRSFAKNLELVCISLCTEEVVRREGDKSRVSAIEITVTKP